ncbi:MAG: DUF2892 domain-containing protein [Halobacteriales archaeon]
MKLNVGGGERTARLVVGALLLVVGLAGYAGMVPVAVGPFPQFLTSVVLALVGLILVVTGAVRFCPLNALFGRNSARR